MIIVVKHIAKKEVEHNIDKKIVLIGRSDASDIVIDSSNISRLHLEVKIEEDKIFIKDTSAKNWVSYNGEQLSKTEFIQYFDFMPLVLPDNYTIGIRLNHAHDEDDNRTISRADLLRRAKTKTKTRSKRAIKSLEEDVETKPTKIKNQKNEVVPNDPGNASDLDDEEEEDSSTKKWIIIIAASLLFLVVYAYLRGLI